jgi:hypothetical protein
VSLDIQVIRASAELEFSLRFVVGYGHPAGLFNLSRVLFVDLDRYIPNISAMDNFYRLLWVFREGHLKSISGHDGFGGGFQVVRIDGISRIGLRSASESWNRCSVARLRIPIVSKNLTLKSRPRMPQLVVNTIIDVFAMRKQGEQRNRLGDSLTNG